MGAVSGQRWLRGAIQLQHCRSQLRFRLTHMRTLRKPTRRQPAYLAHPLPFRRLPSVFRVTTCHRGMQRMLRTLRRELAIRLLNLNWSNLHSLHANRRHLPQMTRHQRHHVLEMAAPLLQTVHTKALENSLINGNAKRQKLTHRTLPTREVHLWEPNGGRDIGTLHVRTRILNTVLRIYHMSCLE